MPLLPGPSILSGSAAPAGPGEEAAEIFTDLNLGQVVGAAVRGREGYDLAPFFSAPLQDPAAIVYRQRVCAELEDPGVRRLVEAFAAAMRAVHGSIERSRRAGYRYQKLAWHLDAAALYAAAVERLAGDLGAAGVRSDGLRALAGYLVAYTSSEPFRWLVGEVGSLRAELARISYALAIRGPRIAVRRYAGEPDYSAEVERTFERFRQAGSRTYDFEARPHEGVNPLEEQILDQVVQLWPEPFARLRALAERADAFPDPTVLRFEREVQFLLAYLDLLAPLREAGLSVCYPTVVAEGREYSARDTYDLPLALALGHRPGQVVPNDILLSGNERVLVVTGPNQGGKTTFARTMGQLPYLARLGLPVPGRDARLPLCDRVFTLFEQAERSESLRGRLEGELVRARQILRAASPRSLLVLNESFSGTSLHDATFLGRAVLDEILRRGAIAVYVTFVDELSRIDPAVVSLVSTVSPEDPTVRTFRVVRAVADGRAFATAIAAKYGLTYARLRGPATA